MARIRDVAPLALVGTRWSGEYHRVGQLLGHLEALGSNRCQAEVTFMGLGGANPGEWII